MLEIQVQMFCLYLGWDYFKNKGKIWGIGSGGYQGISYSFIIVIFQVVWDICDFVVLKYWFFYLNIGIEGFQIK